MMLPMEYLKHAMAFIVIGMGILIIRATARSVDGESFSCAGRNFETDTSSLLQAWLQQPDTSMKWVPQNREDPVEGPSFLGPIFTTDDDYDFIEWNQTAPTGEPPLPVDYAAGELNLCMRDHLIPEFMLVGTVKAATTTFAANIRQSPGIVFPSVKLDCEDKPDLPEGFCFDDHAKEGHFFDYHKSGGVEFMAARFPKCRRDARMIATDESPRYLLDPEVPFVIKKWYGTANLQNRLKFIIALREPVARFHSDYYHARYKNWCFDHRLYTFGYLVQRILNYGQWQRYVGGNIGCSDRLEGSLYPPQVKRWFNLFDPSQFIIAPYLYITDPKNNGRQFHKPVAEYIWNLYGLPLGKIDEHHLNVHEHPPLEEDINSNVLKQFRALIYRKHGPQHLAAVLTEHQGATLYGYSGSSSDTAAITSWLESNW